MFIVFYDCYSFSLADKVRSTWSTELQAALLQIDKRFRVKKSAALEWEFGTAAIGIRPTGKYMMVWFAFVLLFRFHWFTIHFFVESTKGASSSTDQLKRVVVWVCCCVENLHLFQLFLPQWATHQTLSLERSLWIACLLTHHNKFLVGSMHVSQSDFFDKCLIDLQILDGLMSSKLLLGVHASLVLSLSLTILSFLMKALDRFEIHLSIYSHISHSHLTHTIGKPIHTFSFSFWLYESGSRASSVCISCSTSTPAESWRELLSYEQKRKRSPIIIF